MIYYTYYCGGGPWEPPGSSWTGSNYSSLSCHCILGFNWVCSLPYHIQYIYSIWYLNKMKNKIVILDTEEVQPEPAALSIIVSSLLYQKKQKWLTRCKTRPKVSRCGRRQDSHDLVDWTTWLTLLFLDFTNWLEIVHTFKYQDIQMTWHSNIKTFKCPDNQI